MAKNQLTVFYSHQPHKLASFRSVIVLREFSSTPGTCDRRLVFLSTPQQLSLFLLLRELRDIYDIRIVV